MYDVILMFICVEKRQLYIKLMLKASETHNILIYKFIYVYMFIKKRILYNMNVIKYYIKKCQIIPRLKRVLAFNLNQGCL